MGRPKKEIDWTTVDAMLKVQCTGEEISGILDVDYKTLERRCKEEHKMGFGEYSKLKRDAGKASLRRMQWKACEKGTPSMLIWLGKQMLQQADKPEDADTDTPDSTLELVPDE